MSYQFEHSWQHERERLAALERGGDPSTVASLTSIGVKEGWRCLEIGAGGGSIARWLCERVGSRGSVVATDLETGFLREIAAANLEVRRHDIRSGPPEENAFDLVCARKVLEHLPEHRIALQNMVRAAKPGGWVLVEDGDLVSVFAAVTSDIGFFRRAYHAFVETMAAAGYQPDLGTHLGAHLLDAGLEEIQIRGRAGEWTGAGDQPSVFLRTFEKIRDRVVADRRLSAEEADRLLMEIQSPSFRAVTAIHFAAWGRKPGPGAHGPW
jgi:ubiquinone/menaquinone biosynthesis C-methylase UbiE